MKISYILSVQKGLPLTETVIVEIAAVVVVLIILAGVTKHEQALLIRSGG